MQTFQVTDFSLGDILSIVHLSHDNPYTIPGVNHHSVDTSSEVYQNLKKSLESDVKLDFIDLHFGGVLYDICDRRGLEAAKPPLVSFTGDKTLHSKTFTIRRELSIEYVSKFQHLVKNDLIGKNLMDIIVEMQETTLLRLAIVEGMHRIHVFLNHLKNVSSLDESSAVYQKMKQLLQRKVHLVVYVPTRQQQALDAFISSCYQESLRISKNKASVAQHSYSDQIKNCYQHYLIQQPSSQNILNSNIFGDDNKINWTSMKVADDVFIRLLDSDNYEWVGADGVEKIIRINSSKGLSILGTLHTVNVVTKAAEPWQPKNVYFVDERNKRMCQLKYKDMCMYCVVIVFCFSDESREVFGSVLLSISQLLTAQRVCKFRIGTQ